ncbi:Y-family DNA polymerase [Sediminibacterium soli]|uniref:Y-family DNA polymerase n=1 Tax=Sediminibacterium soli TaxID=2698829 RepID=UPI001379EC4C|nr:DNA polymerase Y family protein [Sediminibacterium soli]NCI47013.1 DNA polymerase Y family protein [Sediminibacterium soli]
MQKRYVTIWFPYLKTDWVVLRNKTLAEKNFVLTVNDHGRKLITAVSPAAHRQGIYPGMVAADACALFRDLLIREDAPAEAAKLLSRLAEWCIRFTPSVTIDGQDGLLLDATGCTHLWGGEENYIDTLQQRLAGFGLHTRISMADTIGAAWALSRFTTTRSVLPGQQVETLLPLPPAALRLDTVVVERLEKLGLRSIGHFIHMPRSVLLRRFGKDCVQKIRFALGEEEEIHEPIHPLQLYQERLPCLEPIFTPAGIDIALRKLLGMLCDRLRSEGRGLRTAVFTGYRIDGKTVSITIGAGRALHNEIHLHKLFLLKFGAFEPGPGIELFTLDATKTDEITISQLQLWGAGAGLHNTALSELLDRMNNRFGEGHIHRYLPDEHHWPERSVKKSSSLLEKTATGWRPGRPRPLHLLPVPERIEVAAPIPDYPPMHFRHKGVLHKTMKADGPERIEQEWWLQTGLHRDYYCVEDETGNRFWLFRLGHYDEEQPPGWFLHGYFV